MTYSMSTGEIASVICLMIGFVLMMASVILETIYGGTGVYR